MKTVGIIALFILGLTALWIGCGTCNYAGRAIKDGVETAHKEFDPSAMLKKYEWFKNQSQFILKAQKDIENLKSESNIRQEFEADNGKNHSAWSPIVQNSYQNVLEQNRQQRLALVSNTNKLIADYNAQSAKFTWDKFLTRDDLPPQTFSDVK